MKYLIILLTAGIIGVSGFWVITKTNNSPTPRSASARIDSTNSDFTFAITADPHMDEQSDSAVLKQTLANIVAAKPAFLIDLGDFSMVDKLPQKNEANIRSRYELMKSYYSALEPAIPLYMVIGNHDGEAGWDSFNTKELRLEYFPTEYSENNYYSFEQNNTLFVILDPYTYTTSKPNDNGWLWTLGKTQYDWLKSTLETSKAKYKFVFIHQLVGGDNQGRGGVEYAKFFEWGGNNKDGSYGFDTNRAGWGKPIHQLLVDNGVQVVFKGHDHFYAKQELDGIIYQTLPQPSHPGDKVNTAAEYGYTSGEILGGSGYLRVSVSDSDIIIEFIGTQLTGGIKSKLNDSYTVLSE